jgi:O-antigen/teichoic acid export membrane protein
MFRGFALLPDRGRRIDLLVAGCQSGSELGGQAARECQYIFDPLVALCIPSDPAGVYLSTYLLQRWYGSIEQGNFALASKWSAFVLVFTSSALSIFWREIAHAMANKEHARAANVYLQFTHILFFLSIVLCTWLSFGSTLLVKILVGNEYAPAIPVLMIMAFYPLQQTYGQINVAALKGAERTKLVRNLGIMISIPDLLLSYFLLASVDAPIPGLNLGAVGVAIRMVVYGLISVQAYEWVSHRVFNLSYVKSLARKAGVAVIVVLCALVSMAGIGALLSHSNMLPLFTLAICSVAYFTLVWAVLLLLPEMVGLERMVLLNYIQQARAEINKYLPWRS